MSTKLDATTNFLDLYLHAAGDSEVPATYHVWAGLALLAASVADRVWLPKFGKLVPNLYVALLGPSANGKGEAIRTATKLAKDHPKLNVYKGKASIQYLLDYMAHSRVMPDGSRYDNAAIFLVTPELSMALRKGDSADDFVKNVTELYTPDSEIPFLEGTRGSGTHRLTRYCINWISGSTLEWMQDCLPPDAISGGFFGRCVGIYQGYDKTKRVETPRLPLDHDAVTAFLHARLDELTEIEGQFEMTPAARRAMTTWYTERHWPTDDALVPAWKRQHDLVLKLAMLLSLADDLTLTINGRHIEAARQLSDSVLKRLSEVQAAAATTPATKGIAFASAYLRGMKRPIMHSELLRRFTAKGLGDKDAMRIAVETLMESGLVARRMMGRGHAYEFVGRRHLPADDNGASPTAAAAD